MGVSLIFILDKNSFLNIIQEWSNGLNLLDFMLPNVVRIIFFIYYYYYFFLLWVIVGLFLIFLIELS